jgi:phage terminase large subunit-like protein
MSLPHQQTVLLSDARFKLLGCGRQWGKTHCALCASIIGHGSAPGKLVGAAQGGVVWWVAKTYKQAAKNWRALKRATQELWISGLGSKHELERRIQLPGGGSVQVVSADDPDNLRGDTLDGAVLDEAAFMPQRVWHDVIRPALSVKQGWALFATTPNGHNWFKKLFDESLGREGWQRWQRPTSDNPEIPAAEIETMRSELGWHGFAQECLAQFVAIEGAMFESEWFGDHIWFDNWPSDPLIKTMALDPSMGKTDKSDYSAFAMTAFGRDGLIYIDADIAQRPPPRIIEDGTRIAKTFSPLGFGIEANSFQSLLKPMFQQAGVELPIWEMYNTATPRGCNLTLPAKSQRIWSLTAPLNQRLLRFKRHSHGAEMLVDQLRSFPVASHDDGPDALEMSIRLREEIIKATASDGLPQYLPGVG